MSTLKTINIIHPSGATTNIVNDSSGNVGIGTASPSAKLQINSVDGVNTIFRATSGANNGRLNVDVSDAAGTVGFSTGGNSTFPAITFATSSTERLRIDASGNVGIGTSSPQQKLQVYSSGSSGGAIQVTNASTGAASTDGVVFGYDGSNDVIINNQEATALKLYTSGSERMRILSGGNVLIGRTTATASEIFSAVGNGTEMARFEQSTNTSGYSGIVSSIQQNGNNTSTWHFRGNTNNVANWYLYGNGTTSYSSDARLKKNIETTRNGYLGDLCKLRVVKYNWKDDADS
jgi:hypothetical protein